MHYLSIFYSKYEIFPYTVPKEGPAFVNFTLTHGAGFEPGKGWSSGTQGGYQMLALIVTLGIAILGGIITGD